MHETLNRLLCPKGPSHILSHLSVAGTTRRAGLRSGGPREEEEQPRGRRQRRGRRRRPRGPSSVQPQCRLRRLQRARRALAPTAATATAAAAAAARFGAAAVRQRGGGRLVGVTARVRMTESPCPLGRGCVNWPQVKKLPNCKCYGCDPRAMHIDYLKPHRSISSRDQNLEVVGKTA